MHEIKCPHCGTTFTVDEAGYADILSQVRDEAFDKAVHDRLALAEKDKAQAVELAEAKIARQMQEASASKDAEIARLKSEIRNAETAEQLAITKATHEAEKERDALKHELQAKEIEYQLKEADLAQQHQAEIRTREQEIERLRDHKLRLSTKMIGETLEQHCEIEFDKLRATAFPHAYFEKDNDASSGSKGD